MYNYFEINFPTISMPNLTAYTVEFRQARYAHETLNVFLKNWAFNIDNLLTGTPVEVTLRGHRTNRKFIGYVHHAKPDISPTRNFVELFLIGASFVMKQQEQKVWLNTSATNVAIEIAKKHNFAYKVTPHSRVFDQLTQGGESDWEFLVKLAKQIGYTMRAENTTLIFEPITQNYTDTRASAHIYRMGDIGSANITDIFSFKPLIGESTPFVDAKKSVVAVSGADGINSAPVSFATQDDVTAMRRKVGAPLFDRYDTHTVAPSFSAAKYEADAAVQRNRYPYRATADVYGDPALSPDSPVYLSNVGKDYSGFWTVLEAEHTIKDQKFVTTLELGTDSLGMATPWEDGNHVVAPDAKPKRVIIAGKPSVQKVSAHYLHNQGKPLSTNTPRSLGLVKNKTISPTQLPITKWVSPSGDLTATPINGSTASPAVRARRGRADVY